jgi:hypothetical protein
MFQSLLVYASTQIGENFLLSNHRQFSTQPLRFSKLEEARVLVKRSHYRNYHPADRLNEFFTSSQRFAFRFQPPFHRLSSFPGELSCWVSHRQYSRLLVFNATHDLPRSR